MFRAESADETFRCRGFMKPFFSFVIPCCDVEPYIRECLDSILGQSFQDWECLAGVETSRDRTEEIVREYAARDSRIRVFTCERSGSCSHTRNLGTDMAQGEYVIFLDGDDTIEKGSLARIAEKIKARPGADLYPCEIVAYDEATGEREIRENYPPEKSPAELTGPEAVVFIGRFDIYPCPMLQMTVFRREFLTEHDLKCIYGLRRQDSEFSPRALYLARRVVPLHEPFYLYRIRANSVSTAARGAGYFHRDFAIILHSLFAFLAQVSKQSDFDPRVGTCWSRQWGYILLSKWFSARFVREIPRKERQETLKIVFAEGFGDLAVLLRYGTRARKIAGWWVRFFVRHPGLGWLAEWFFLYGYFPLQKLKSEK